MRARTREAPTAVRLRALLGALTTVDTVVIALALVSVALVLASLVMRWVGVEPYVTLFAVTSEQNIPTWFSSGLLLVAAVAAAGVSTLVPRAKPRLRGSWYVVAAGLAALSIDDAAGLHERLGGIGAQLVGGQRGGGLLHFAWVVPGVVLGALVVVSVLGLARQLPAHVRRQLVFGTALFFGGALGMEMVSGVVLDNLGDGHVYAVVTSVEELLEMLGAIVILRGIFLVVRVDRRSAGSFSLQYIGAASRGRPAPTASSPRRHRAGPESAQPDPARPDTARPDPAQPEAARPIRTRSRTRVG